MDDIILGWDFRRECVGEALRGVLRLPSANADFVGCQVVVDMVHTAKLTKPPQLGVETRSLT